MKRLLWGCALAWALGGGPAAAYELLRNDSFEAGDGVAFYTRIGQDESFAAIYEVPDDHPVYRVCRVLPFVGPDNFNIYTLRLGLAGPDGAEAGAGENLIWQSDQDAYQVFGSQNQLGSIDLVAEDIVTDVRRLRVQLRVVGNERAPNIATDGDGITPERNYVRVLLRNGQAFRGFTEGMDPEGSPPAPGGDWILRTEIVRPDENCPDPGALPPDMGPDEVFDMGGGVDDMGLDGGPDPPMDLDAGVDRPDAAPVPDMYLPPDADPPPDRGGNVGGDDATVGADRGGPGADRGAGPGGDPLELVRITPDRGPSGVNTEVVINGRGFLDGGGITRAALGESRLLEATALSGSTLTALVPAGMMPGPHDLRLERADGQVAVLPDAYVVQGEGPAALALSGIEPETIRAGSATELTVRGAGFSAAVEFSIGGAPLEDAVIADDGRSARATLRVPLAAGVYDVVARRGDELARLEQALTVTGGGAAVEGCRVATPRGHGGGWLSGILLVLLCRRRTR